jgi:hypothetical protein
MKKFLISESEKQRILGMHKRAIRKEYLMEQTVDGRKWGVPGAESYNTVYEFDKWYSGTYLKPTEGYVGNTIIVLSGDDQLNGPQEIVDRFVVSSCFTKSYEKGMVYFYTTPKTKNFDLTTNTMNVNGETMSEPLSMLYDSHDLVAADLSLVPDESPAFGPLLVPIVKKPQELNNGSVKLNPAKIEYAIDYLGNVYNKGQKIGFFNFGKPYELVPNKADGYGFTKVTDGIETPIQDLNWWNTWMSTNTNKGKVITQK